MSRQDHSSQLLRCCLVAAAFAFSANAADGTWKSTSAGGDWFTAGNWVDGVIPGGGGTATFNFTGQTAGVEITGSNWETVALGGLDIYCALNWNRNIESYFDKMVMNFVAPADINIKNGNFVFRANVLSNECGVLVHGDGERHAGPPRPGARTCRASRSRRRRR